MRSQSLVWGVVVAAAFPVTLFLGCGGSSSSSTTTGTGGTGAGTTSSTAVTTGQGGATTATTTTTTTGSGGGGGSGTGGTTCAPVQPHAGAPFLDKTAELGITFTRHQTDNNFGFEDTFGGGGVCLLDYDGDGKLDVYFADRAPHPNRLYHNTGSGFTDASAGSGADVTTDSMGCMVLDYDSDGDVDLFVTNSGSNQLLRNDGGGKFTDVSEAAGIFGDGLNLSATVGDMDGDGDLDIAVARHVKAGSCAGGWKTLQTCMFMPNLLFQNQGDGTFSEVSAARGITLEESTLISLFVDFDSDGDLDLYFGNDVAGKFSDRFYENDGTGNFVDKGVAWGVATDGAGNSGETMGIDVGDYDRDGHLDMAISNFAGDSAVLYKCDPGPTCVDTQKQGFQLPGNVPAMKWAVQFADVDLDGWLDLMIAAGDLEKPGGQQNLFYWNQLGTFALYAPSGASDALSVAQTSRGIAVGDLDGDGHQDMVIANREGPPQVLINQAAWGHWLAIDLGTQSIGANVTVTVSGASLTRPVVAGGSYLAASDQRLWFGLAEACAANVTVKWLDGTTKVVSGAAADQILKISKN